MTAPAVPAPAALHVVVGPPEHGVVRHAVAVATTGGSPLVRLERARPLTQDEVGGATILHVPFTDRLFGATAEESLAAFLALTGPWVDRGLGLSVTLHDLPAGDSAVDRRRRATYREVVDRAAGVVVNSRRELELAGALDVTASSLRCIPLPVEPAVEPAAGGPVDGDPGPAGAVPRAVTVLGFVFPDRGYEHTIAELPDGVDLVALGRPSAGHEDLSAALAEVAAATGHTMTTTGFVPDEVLGAALRAAAVPVAPNRRVAASASIGTWVAHGRRPLVPDSPYGRELDSRWPGTVRLYDADAPGALRREVERALVDPARTLLPPGTVVGPGAAEVAAEYARHLAGCLPPAPVRVGADRWVVPGNRWDLLDGRAPREAPTVTVVVPHHEAQADLDLVLTALTLQDHPPARLQVVVADDGSRTAPDTGAARGLDVRVVRQERAGFRAAAARNLGASVAEGEVVAFLDGDTVPEPSYLRHLTRLPALAPDAVTVGRRRHADLGGWSPGRLAAWLAGNGAPPVELTEPVWLREAYASTHDLRDVDDRSHRFVISAVMALHRDLLTELGGFDEGFTSYGGEDWELTHRAYVAGAVLAHVPAAVAWHDGPEWGERHADPATAREAKNHETLALAAHLPDPAARGGGQWDRPAVVVVLGFADPVEVMATSRAALSGDTDGAVWVDHPEAEACVTRLGDRRVSAGPPPESVLASALAVLRLDAPARVTGLTGLADLATRCGPVSLPTGTLVTQRAARRARRWAPVLGVDEQALRATLFGAHDLVGPPSSRPVDLARELSAVYREATSGPSVSRS